VTLNSLEKRMLIYELDFFDGELKPPPPPSFESATDMYMHLHLVVTTEYFVVVHYLINLTIRQSLYE